MPSERAETNEATTAESSLFVRRHANAWTLFSWSIAFSNACSKVSSSSACNRPSFALGFSFEDDGAEERNSDLVTANPVP